MKSTLRAFIAIDISAGIRSAAHKTLKPLKQAFPNVKWVDDEQFHVTLKFLGPNVPTTELHKLILALERACQSFEQFDLIFEGLGAFPNASNPRTIWIGVTDGVDELRRLAGRIDAELEKLGYPVEGREFSPHLTIGRTRRRDRDGGGSFDDDQFSRKSTPRVASSRRAAESDDVQDNFASLTRMIYDRANVFFGSSPVDAVILYSSELDRNGPQYEPLATIDLAPLGSVPDEEDRDFDPRLYDSDEFKIDEKEMTEHFPGVRETRIDVAALDADVEEELRAICGDSFTRRSNPSSRGSAPSPKSSNTPRPNKAFNAAKRKDANRPSVKASLKTDAPELDEMDFSELDELLKSDQIQGQKRRPQK